MNRERSRCVTVAAMAALLPESLVESELSRYEKGAFTGALTRKPGKFELAHCGTLFLDEIGDCRLKRKPSCSAFSRTSTPRVVQDQIGRIIRFTDAERSAILRASSSRDGASADAGEPRRSSVSSRRRCTRRCESWAFTGRRRLARRITPSALQGPHDLPADGWPQPGRRRSPARPQDRSSCGGAGPVALHLVWALRDRFPS